MKTTLQEFAKQVLFSDSLEEKLSCPVGIVDDDRGSPLTTPSAPGRPRKLRFSDAGQKSSFPKTSHLERETNRGILLHFFANHELLATELMALVLLKFPDAPRAFRKGILQTLREEQTHTRLYLRRMQRYGIEFGDLPVNDFFWKCVSGMESPMDYVCRLSLTFEQANLDYSRFYADQFQRIGDAETQALFQRIYTDEISHVGYGLKWFRKWKDAAESNWNAFQKQLHFPLTPNRAKAAPFNVEGRKKAGLDDDFINELNVYSHSKGRTPSVFWFNPLAEWRIGAGKNFHPKRYQKELVRDLENLPQFLCRQDDVVLVQRKPSIEFLNKIKNAGFSLPEFEVLKEGSLASDSGLRDRKIGRLRPWAWSPESAELLTPIFPNLTGESTSANERWNERIARVFSKSWCTAFLEKFLDDRKDTDWLCGRKHIGALCTDMDSVLAKVQEIRKTGHHPVVVKAPYGVAGGAMIRLLEEKILDKQLAWIARVFEEQKEVVVASWLERVMDFSLQLEVSKQGVTSCGFTRLINDRWGRFQAVLATRKFLHGLPTGIQRFLRGGDGGKSNRFEELFHALARRLNDSLQSIGYFGPVGIDAFVFRDQAGALRLKPVVEINPRYTFGRLALELMKNTAPGSSGLFVIVNHRLVQSRGFATLAEYAEHLEKRFPLELRGSPRTKIREGVVALNDPERAAGHLSIFHVSRSIEQLLD